MSGILFVDSLVFRPVREIVKFQNLVTVVLGEPYQHDRKAMELVLRFLDGENEMVHRECWVESSSASPPKSEWVKEEKQADMRLIIKPKKK